MTNKLERGRKVDLPIVVRQTLNDMAFNAKKTTLPASYAKAFKQRSKGFLKWASTAEPAVGLSVPGMSASIGILAKPRMATSNLAKHQDGGRDTPDKVYETEEARVGKSWDKGVKSKYSFKNKSPVWGKKIRRGQNTQFIREAHKKAPYNGFVRYENTVYEVNRLSSNRLKFEKKYILNSKGNYHKAEKTNFMFNAMKPQLSKANAYFTKNFNKRMLK